MKTKIAIITAPRSGGIDTLNPTIQSLLETDHSVLPEMIGVFNDGVLLPVLKRTVGHVAIRTAEELAVFRSLGRYFGSFNFARACRWAAQETEAVVVTDDDVILTAHWLQKAEGLLQAAREHGHERSIIAFQHFYPTLEQFIPTEISHANLDLWRPSPEARSNGLFPAIMPAAVAEDLASVTVKLYPTNESDYALFRFCTVHASAMLFYTEPCLAEHMNIASHFVPANWPKQLLQTKRFRAE